MLAGWKNKKRTPSQLIDRSEGFFRTGYLVPGRDGLGVPPDAQSSWDAAAVAVPPTGAPPAPDRRPPPPAGAPRDPPPSPGGPYAVHIDKMRADGPYIDDLKVKNEG